MKPALMIVAALVLVGCSRVGEVAGVWDMIKNRPNCGHERNTWPEELTLAPTMYAKIHRNDPEYRDFREEHGIWRMRGSSIDVEITEIETPGGTFRSRTVTTYSYERHGNELQLFPVSEKRYGQNEYATTSTPIGDERCGVSYRKTAELTK